MSLRLTPATLEGAYEYLRTTAPFNKWRLPEADGIAFEVTGHDDRYGHHQSWPSRSRKHEVIAISNTNTKTSAALIETMAHEMCHLQSRILFGYRKRGQGHGPRFRELARAVCRNHGFDLKTF